jgi:ligand-binding SRPBCC domain-containing protein
MMKLNTIRRVQNLPVSLGKAWDFFSDPSKLAEITPAWLGLDVKSELPPRMHAGMVVRYTIRPFTGVSVQWITEITHAEEPFFFVDEQRFGPYKFWHHQHIFKETANGCEMTDQVDYALYGGFLGELVHSFYVRGRLEEIFDYRYKKLAEIFGQV